MVSEMIMWNILWFDFLIENILGMDGYKRSSSHKTQGIPLLSSATLSLIPFSLILFERRPLPSDIHRHDTQYHRTPRR